MNPTLRWALPLSSLAIIAAGGVVAASGDTTTGLLIAAVGMVDLLTVPFVLRWIGASRGRAPGDPQATDPTEDPDYNPYARED
jgi:hypothetical protein